jgi:hypothetical protein
MSSETKCLFVIFSIISIAIYNMTEIIQFFHIELDNAREANIPPVEMPREALAPADLYKREGLGPS